MAAALRFGISLQHGGRQPEDAAGAFATVLATAVGREHELVVTADYEQLLQAVVGGRCDVAWMPPLTLSRAMVAGAQLACVSQRRGRTLYRAAFVARRDSRFTDVRKLAGARVAWTNASSAAGYVIPRATLGQLGVEPSELGSETFYGTVAAACEAVRAGWEDVATCYVSNDAVNDAIIAQLEIERQLGPQTELGVIGVTPVIPPDGFVIATVVDANARGRLTNALLDLHRREGGIAAMTAMAQVEKLVTPTADVFRQLTQLSALASR